MDTPNSINPRRSTDRLAKTQDNYQPSLGDNNSVLLLGIYSILGDAYLDSAPYDWSKPSNYPEVYLDGTISAERINVPCFMVKLDNYEKVYANNKNYKPNVRWTITFITSTIFDGRHLERFIDSIPYFSFDRMFLTNSLYHYVFTLYTKEIEQ